VLPSSLNSALQPEPLDSLSGFLRSLPPLNLSTFKCALCIPDASSGCSSLPTVLQVRPRPCSFSEASAPKSFESSAHKMLPFCTILVHPKSFRCNTYGSPRKCCKQKTYGLAKPFRCSTYKKHGGGGSLPFPTPSTFGRSNLRTLRGVSVLSPLLSGSCALLYTTASSQPFSYQSLPHSFGRDGGCIPCPLGALSRICRTPGTASSYLMKDPCAA
jgi:hypothetical protein